MMAGMGDHAKPVQRKDHLWVLVIIAACALLEVWASWLSIGAISGFPRLGHMTTGWILPVSTEAYWGYAVWAWLVGASGQRSRKFAMWTAAGMFVLSLGGQESAHLIAAAGNRAPWYAVVLVTALPLFAVGLAAVLVHLRQADREEAAEAVRLAAEADRQAAIERAEADERTALRAALGEARAALEPLRAELEAVRSELGGELENARRETAEALGRAEAIAQKLAAVSARKARKQPSATAQGSARESAQGDDATTEWRALMELRADPQLWKPRMGGELARRLGVAGPTGRRYHSRFVRDGKLADPIHERSAEGSDERSGERS